MLLVQSGLAVSGLNPTIKTVVKEEISGGHKDCTVPETGYCLIVTPLGNPLEAHHNAAGSEVSLMRRS